MKIKHIEWDDDLAYCTYTTLVLAYAAHRWLEKRKKTIPKITCIRCLRIVEKYEEANHEKTKIP